MLIAVLLCTMLAATLVFFYGFYEWTARRYINEGQSRLSMFEWIQDNWRWRDYFRYGWLVLIAMIPFVWKAFRRMRNEPVAVGGVGSGCVLGFGLFLWFLGVRGSFLIPAALSLPILLLGGGQFVLGWKCARHLLFPLSLFAFIIPWGITYQQIADFGSLSSGLSRQLFNLFNGPALTGHDGFWARRHGGMFTGPRLIPLEYSIMVLFVCWVYLIEMHRNWTERLILAILSVPVALLVDAVRITSVEIQTPLSNPWVATYPQGKWELAAVILLTLLILFALSCIIRLSRRVFARRKQPSPVAEP